MVRKGRGLEWPCASCSLHFPANGFIDDSRRHVSDQLANRDAIQEYCIAPGSSCQLIYLNAHVFYVQHVSFNDRMLSSLHRNNRIALHQVTGAAAELVLDSDWMGSASPSQLLPCATARVASSTDRCITFRTTLPCASLVRSTQILKSFHAGSATSQLRCSTGAGAGMSTVSNYAILACPMLQTSSATSARKQRVCSALVSRTQLSKSTSL